MSNDEEVTAHKLTIARQEATIARQEALINDQLELIREMNDAIAKLKVCTNALTLESIYQSPSKALRLQSILNGLSIKSFTNLKCLYFNFKNPL